VLFRQTEEFGWSSADMKMNFVELMKRPGKSIISCHTQQHRGGKNSSNGISSHHECEGGSDGI